IWTFDSGRNAYSNGHGRIDPTDIQVVNGIVYYAIAERVIALNAKTGTAIWIHNFSRTNTITSDPALSSDTLYVITDEYTSNQQSPTSSSVYALDARTGTQKWAVNRSGETLGSPQINANKVYILSGQGVQTALYILNPTDGSIETQKILPGSFGFLVLKDSF